MAKKDKDDVTEGPIDVAEVRIAPPVTKVHLRPRTKVYTFEQWAKMHNKHERHMRGMRAFLGKLVGNKYPLEKWDELMKAY